MFLWFNYQFYVVLLMFWLGLGYLNLLRSGLGKDVSLVTPSGVKLSNVELLW